MIDSIVDEVWKEVKEDIYNVQKIETLAEKGITFGNIDLEGVFKPKFDSMDNTAYLKGRIKDLVPMMQDANVTPEIKHYLLNAVYQQNFRRTMDAMKKLFNLPQE